MAVIIGAGTTVVSSQVPGIGPGQDSGTTDLFDATGIVSIQFGFNPQVDRLYQLGSFSPYDTSVTRTPTLSVTVYGSRADDTGGSAAMVINPSTTCADANRATMTVSPAACEVSALPFTRDYYLTSYSYSKDNLGFGQETWSFTGAPEIDTYTGTIVMLRGIAEGTIQTGAGTMSAADMGVVIDELSSNDINNAEITGDSGSVAAGTPGIGEYTIERFIIATSVGGARGRHEDIDGQTGQASVNIPMTPVFL
jgi:hypothetical protein